MHTYRRKVVRNSFNNKWSNFQVTWRLRTEKVMKDELASQLNTVGHPGESPACSLVGCHLLGRKLGYATENPRGPGFVGKPIFSISQHMLQLPVLQVHLNYTENEFWAMLHFYSHGQTKSYICMFRKRRVCCRGTKGRDRDLGFRAWPQDIVMCESKEASY